MAIIETAGGSLQATLNTIANSGTLELEQQDFESPQPFLVDGTLELANGTIGAPTLTVGAGGLLEGVGTINSPVIDDGAVVPTYDPNYGQQGNADLLFEKDVSGPGTIDVAPYRSTYPFNYYGIVEFATSASTGVRFDDASGTLVLDDPLAFTGTISGFSTGKVTPFGITPVPRLVTDSIFMPGVSITAITGSIYAGNSVGGTLILELGYQTVPINFQGNYNTGDFAIAAGTQALSTVPPGIVITDTAPPCFMRGTRVASCKGWIAVESLIVGDQLVTASGRLASVHWIGHRAIKCRAHPRKDLVWPVESTHMRSPQVFHHGTSGSPPIMVFSLTASSFLSST